MHLGSTDLSDPETFVAGVPYDYFAFLRSNHPVSYQPREGGGGFWSITRHADITVIEPDYARFTSTRGVSVVPIADAVAQAMGDHMIIWSDPPRHTFLRKIVNRAFTPRAIARLEEQLAGMARDAVDAVIERGSCDFVEVAAHLPIEAIAEMLGVPDHDRPRMFAWTTAMFGAEDPECSDLTRQAIGMMEALAYARRHAVNLRAKPGDDIFSAIATAVEDGRQLSELDMGVFFTLLVVAGNETTRTLLLQGVLALIEHPEQFEALRRDRSLMPDAISELLRWTTPAHCMGRTTTEDVEVGGQLIPAGEQVILWYVSANRDEAVFDRPDVFDIRRSDAQRQLAFGPPGPHHCIGAALARMEAVAMLNEVMDRMDGLRLAGPVSRLRSNFTNGIKRMPVAFAAGERVGDLSHLADRPPLTLDPTPDRPDRSPAPIPAAPPAATTAVGGTVNLEVRHLATAVLELGAPIFIPDGPRGMRVVAEISGARWEGDRIRANQIGVAAADWALIAPDGATAIDVRSTLQTDDGALIYVSYTGRTDYSQLGAAPVIAAPTFETGDPRYAWLNKIQAIARGTAEGMERLTYEVFEVL